MHVPFISPPRTLGKRKGGGGKGGGGGSSGGSSGGGRSSSVSTGSSSSSASTYGRGGGPVSTIPSGQTFAGRQQGGGTRDQVVGSSYYGSGYPATYGYAGRGAGVAGRAFPFLFWPIAWGGAAGIGTAAYFHSSEYGDARNGTRPGGTEAVGAFKSIASNTTVRVMADWTSVNELIQDIRTNCSAHLDSSSSNSPSQFDDSHNQTLPRPEQAIQYYRASSVVLTLDNYNNTAVYGDGNGTQTALPSWTNTTFLDCINGTIVEAVPLIDGGAHLSPNLALVAMVWVGWFVSQWA